MPDAPKPPETLEEAMARITALQKQNEDAQAMIGRQTTELGELRVKVGSTTVVDDPAKKSQISTEGPAKGSPATPESEETISLDTMTAKEKTLIDTTWKTMSVEERAALYAEMQGKTPTEKSKAIQTTLLKTIREQYVIPPDDLFGEIPMGAPSQETKLKTDVGALIARTIQTAEKGEFAIPVRHSTSPGFHPTGARPGESRAPAGPVQTSGGIREMIRRP